MNDNNNNDKDNLENAILKLDIANSKGGVCRIPYRRLCQWQHPQHHSTTTTTKTPPPIAAPTTQQRSLPSFQGLKWLVLQHLKERQHNKETTMTSPWHVSISYLDSEGDRILLGSDEDLAEAFATAAAAASEAFAAAAATSSSSSWWWCCHRPKSTSRSAPRKRVPVLKALAIVVVAEQHRRGFFGLHGALFSPNNRVEQQQDKDTTTTMRQQQPCPGFFFFIHAHYSCNACGIQPIIGLRFHATNHFDYDVCSACLELYRETDLQFEPWQCERDRFLQHRLQACLFPPMAQGGQQEGEKESSLPWPCVSSSSSLAAWWQQQQRCRPKEL